MDHFLDNYLLKFVIIFLTDPKIIRIKSISIRNSTQSQRFNQIIYDTSLLDEEERPARAEDPIKTKMLDGSECRGILGDQINWAKPRLLKSNT